MSSQLRQRQVSKWPPWTVSDDSSKILGAELMHGLQKLAISFDSITTMVTTQLKLDPGATTKYSFRPKPVTPKTMSRTVPSQEGNLHKQVILLPRGNATLYDVIRSLRNTACIRTWNLAFNTIVETRPNNTTPIKPGSDFRPVVSTWIRRVREYKEEAWALYLDVRKDEATAALELRKDVEWAIQARFDSLNWGFSELARLRPHFARRQEQIAWVKAVGSPIETTTTTTTTTSTLPTLTAIVPIITLLAALLLIPAWYYSPTQPGSTENVDFWVTVQSTAMQLLGLFTATYPVYYNRPSKPQHAAWNWSIIFTIIGALS
ncbi:hypothetical protein QBC40DRAFT_302326 [Triangularia verruculosa]|uniref:Uncharacterized protein n=1 Tax=Triangularia verruculosa TaxID=2587418 RepID=A0AAN7AQS4_9PEZI|nr:hypothetical protein QBC40DRAFT_302326 [Triangularia verruculosa]